MININIERLGSVEANKKKYKLLSILYQDVSIIPRKVAWKYLSIQDEDMVCQNVLFVILSLLFLLLFFFSRFQQLEILYKFNFPGFEHDH